MNHGKRLACLTLAMATVIPVSLSGFSCSAAKATPTKGASEPTLVMYSWGNKSTGVDRVEKAVNEYLTKKKAGYQIDWHLLNSDDLATKESTMPRPISRLTLRSHHRGSPVAVAQPMRRKAT
jgi:ABC-type glycerol-3-phosphate transport system substrate-binding protein